MPTEKTVPKAFSSLIEKGFEVVECSHANAILELDFPGAMAELEASLSDLDLPVSEIIGSGGGETKFTQRLRRSLAAKDWKKHNFTITKTVDGVPKESTSHEIDHVRRSDNGVLALEIEWNNKDPFFDRDLENFKRLHAEGAISVGMLVTRGSTLQANMHEFVERFVEDRGITSIDELIAHGYRPTPIQRAAVLKQTTRAKDPLTFLKSWTNNFVKSKYGPASTHWDKLLHRVERGVGNPCPLVLIGLPASIVTFGKEAVEALPEAEDANLL